MPAGLAPDGLVVMVFAMPSGEALYERHAAGCDAVADAQLDVVNLIRAGHRVVVRTYDGDTGEPIKRWPWV